MITWNCNSSSKNFMTMGAEVGEYGEVKKKYSTFSEPEHLKNPKIDWCKLLKKRLPIISSLSIYSPSFILQDVFAGIVVGITVIPQAIAFAAIAGLEPQYGLYSAIIGPLVYAMLGSCKDVAVGPSAILSMMLQAYVSNYGPDMAVLITFLGGCIVFILGILHMGFLVQFLSYPVITGSVFGAVITIAVSQFKAILGIPGKSNDFLETMTSIFENITKTQTGDVILGCLTFAALLLIRQLRKYGSLKNNPEWSTKQNVFARIMMYLFLAGNALAIAVGSVLAYVLSDEDGNAPFVLTGDVGEIVPKFELPPFSVTYNNQTYNFLDMMEIYGSSLAFTPLIIILECVAVAKAFSKGKSVDATQEMISAGMCNILGSCFRSLPITSSFSRTAINNASEVCTSLGGLVTGGLVVLALAFLTDAFYYIPKATLAAVVICAIMFVCEYEVFALLWRTKKLDLIPLLVTIVSCLSFGLEYGILIGFAVNIVFVLYSSARPPISVERNKLPCGDTFIVTPSRSLQYPSAEFIREKIIKDCDRFNTTVIIHGKYISSVDATVAKNLKVLAEEIVTRHQRIIFWNFKESVKESCVGVDRKLEPHFREGSLEEVSHDEMYPRLSFAQQK